MAKEVTKPPTGLKITRTGNKFTASWKIGDKDYGDSQHFQYLINDTGKDSWLPKKKTEIGHKTTSKLITTIDKKDYYPNVDKKGNNKPFLYTIGFRVKGNRKKYTTGSGKKKKNHNPSASAWASKDFVLNPPKKPTLTVELDEELTNVCKFSWSAPYADNDSRIFTDVQWQTILVKNSSETDGSKLNWKNAEGGSGGAESNKTITEDTEILYKDGNSYTRWFRVRSRGPRGVYNDDKSYGWVYKKHVYAIPHQTSITGTSASETEEGGFQCVVDWTVGQSGGQNPIDKTTAQYTITIPDEGLTCPSGVSWNDANISRDTGAGDAAVFSIDDQLGKDQCLFIRVNTQHDSNITYGKPQLSAVGFLKDPSGLSVSTDNVTHKAIIRATNNSDVEDSILIVRYVPSIGDPIDIGVIPHDSSSVTVQCPNWDDQEAIAFDVYAIVGTAVKQQRDDGVDSYSVTVRMRSQNTVSQGGSVPVAPKSVSVNRVEGKADTVRVDWDWPWSDAGSAEISWSDHDDAWESTDEPESFLISNLHASHWNISGLETGKTWYIRVRLIAGNMDNSEDVTYGPWSDISQGTIDLSSAPNKPVLLLSNSVIPEDGSTIASWVYTTTDNTAQAYAEVAIVENNEYIPIAHSLTAQHVTIPAQSENYTLSTGNIYNLVCRVKSASGKLSEWSEIVSLTVAEPIACEIVQTSLVHEHIETNPREFEGEGSVEFETEISEDFAKLQLSLEPKQDLHGYDKPWVGGAGKNKINVADGSVTTTKSIGSAELPAGTYTASVYGYRNDGAAWRIYVSSGGSTIATSSNQSGSTLARVEVSFTLSQTATVYITAQFLSSYDTINYERAQIETGTTATAWAPWENFCPISGHDGVEVNVVGKNRLDPSLLKDQVGWNNFSIQLEPNTEYTMSSNIPQAKADSELAAYFLRTYVNPNPSTLIYSGHSFTLTTPSDGMVKIQQRRITGTDSFQNYEWQIEKGSIATDYVPYVEPIEVEQEFDVSLTPTVVDRIPYNFKATGDVRGDRLSQDLIGGTVNWNQLARFTNATRNGITLTANADGSITLQGTATADATFIFNSQELPNHVLLYRGCKNGSASTYGIGNSISGIFQTTSDKIYKTASTGTIYSYVSVKSGTDLTTPVTFTPQFIDLTAMCPTIADYIYSLEQEQAGAGVAWFRKYFSKEYYEYNTGTLKSVNPTTYVTRGVNQWDEEWEKGGINNNTGQNAGNTNTIRTKNYVPILPNTTYYVKAPYNVRAYWYDSDKNYIDTISIGSAHTFVTPVDAHYMRFIVGNSSYPITTYNNDICINISNAGINGQYFPSEHNVYPISELDLRGFPQIVAGELRFDGDIRKPNGQVTRKCILVDLGTLNWIYDGDEIFRAHETRMKFRGKGICTKYKWVQVASWSQVGDGEISVTNSEQSPILRVHDSTAGTDATAFKTAMLGIYIVCELATPITETAPTLADPQVCSIYGTEEFVDEREVPIPVGHVTTYKTRDIFGGTIDLKTGLLTVDKVMPTYSSVYSVALGTSAPLYYWMFATNPKAPTNNVADLISDQYVLGGFEIGKCYVTNVGQLIVAVPADQTLNTKELADAWLEQNPVQFCYKLANPQTYQLTPHELETLIGKNTVSTENGNMSIRIAESVWDGDVLTEMPLEVTVTGAGEGGITSILVERAEDYPMERPDETNFHGNKGEMVLQTSPPLVGTNQASFDTKDLIGPMDDGAVYNIVATVQDGLGQKDSAILPFEVHWAHQAEEPSAEIEIYEEELIAIIKPIAPANADPEDVADIYRLSADKPELIVEGATFGETYVDPYPALGDMGGHRIVTRTKNGDYITEENQIAMVDSPELGVNPIENEDLLNIIDFEGRQIRFYWDTNYSNTWAKDFQETDYLGGSIEGDWNPAVSRSGTLSSKAITVLDQEMLKDVRRLADYPGICHVRTADGSSYAADVQVSEDYTDDEKGMVTNYSLSITKVGSQGFDGMTKEQWDEENPSEEEEES